MGPAALLFLAPTVAAGRGLLFCLGIGITLASCSSHCAYQSKEHRNEQHRKEMLRQHMGPGGLLADLPPDDRAETKKWAFRERYKALVRPAPLRLTDSPMRAGHVLHIVAMILTRRKSQSANKPAKGDK